MTSIEPITAEDIEPLIKMAQGDGHGLWRPTHCIKRNGELSGSVSIGGVPLVTAYINKEIHSPLGFKAVVQNSVKEMQELGFQDCLVAINEDSPAFRFMPALGFHPYISTVWYKDFSDGYK
jgi:hypothetical protein